MGFWRQREFGDQSERASEQCEPIAWPNERGHPGKARKNEPRQQLSEVRGGCGEDDVDRIAFKATQKAAPHPMIAFEMPDLWLDRTASSPAFSFAA